MTTPPDDGSLSRLELVVLARLSCPKPPSERELVDDVAKLAMSTETPARAREGVLGALAALRRRGKVGALPAPDARKPSPAQRRVPKPKPNDRLLTEAGKRALCGAFALAKTPLWPELRDRHLPALGLELTPGSEEAKKALATRDALAIAVLHAQYGLPKAPTLTALGDALLAQALDLPAGPVTLDRLRVHVLARHLDFEGKGKLGEVGPRAAAKAIGARPADKRGLSQALVRRWLKQGEHAHEALVQHVAAPTREGQQPLPQLASTTAPAESLLHMVRETLPLVGADGRFGTEKVFVSAIWRSLEQERRVPELSFDRFKRWLITANREGELILARADLVGAMDPKLVADSEIKDQGATFHFVLDARPTSPGLHRRSHAR